jgi:protein-tyrosine phosphatase
MSAVAGEVMATPSKEQSTAYVNGRPIKTSHSHPLGISWILPPACSGSSTSTPNDTPEQGLKMKLPSQQQPNDSPVQLQSSRMKRSIVDLEENGLQDAVAVTVDSNEEVPSRRRGNLALSSAPGKKVRLVPVSSQPFLNGADTIVLGQRPPVSRDLATDMRRIQSLGITTIINLLPVTELEYLQVSLDTYIALATQCGIDVIHYPIVEGQAPSDMADFEKSVMSKLVELTTFGKLVLCHCRGGIGRAGLVACCWLLKIGQFREAEAAIRFVRARRSLRAIETLEQEKFILDYAEHCHPRESVQD